MRYLFNLILSCVLCSSMVYSAAVPPPQNTSSETYWQFVGQRRDLLENSTVRILLFDENGKALGYGSGFFVTKDIIITAKHVANAGATTIKVKLANSDIVGLDTATVVALDSERDIAILKLTSKNEVYKNQKVLKLADNDISIGSTVYSYGFGRYPMSADNFNEKPGSFAIGARGVVQEPVNDVQDAMVMHSADIFSGHSGSALFNEKGEVVGVNVCTVNGRGLGTDEFNGYSDDRFILMGAEKVSSLKKLLEKEGIKL